MKITVSNLGPIKSAEIRSNKDLLILTGPNNSGKSYVAYLLYAIHDFVSLVNGHGGIPKYLNSQFNNPDKINNILHDNKIYLEHIIVEFKDNIDNFISDLISSNTVKIFASALTNPQVSIDVEDLNLEFTQYDIIGLHVKDGELHVIWNKDGYTKTSLDKTANPTQLLAYSSTLLLEYIKDHDLFGHAFMLPAERTALNLFSRDIIAKKAGSRDDMALRVLAGEDITEIARSITEEQNNTPKYPFAINAYINFVNAFDGSIPVGEFAYLAQELEKSILGGKISVSEFNQLLFHPNGTDNALNLHESSSLIKSLSYLVVYLRHNAKKGEFIIIDEPEINLHPNLQIAIGRFFAKMVNAGLKLIISTHSDYLIKEINNLIILGELNKDEKHQTFVQGKQLAIDELLTKEQVGAYFLCNGKVDPIDLEENGLVVPTINDAIRRVDGLAEELYLEMEG
jgi:hypothetical protein